LGHYGFLLFNSWEFGFYQNRENNIPPDLWFGHDGWMRGAIKSNPSFEVSWRSLEHSFGMPIRNGVNGIFKQKGDERLDMQ
ncbi:MAG: hypothetical protein ACU84Q_09845, partial [Gammaproteobacteria bacterium]